MNIQERKSWRLFLDVHIETWLSVIQIIGFFNVPYLLNWDWIIVILFIKVIEKTILLWLGMVRHTVSQLDYKAPQLLVYISWNDGANNEITRATSITLTFVMQINIQEWKRLKLIFQIGMVKHEYQPIRL